MVMNIPLVYKNLLISFVKNNVEFMIIGGYAVMHHGYQRITNDIDIWLKPNNDNRNKFVKALKISDKELIVISQMDFSKNQVFHINIGLFKIDFLTFVDGLTYEEADLNKESFLLQQTLIPVISFYDLIKLKAIAGRFQDKIDIDILQNK